MSDDNGNVIDSFMPFSTLTEDTAEEIVIQLSLTMEKVLLTVSEKIWKLKKIPRLVYQKKQQNQRVRKSPQMVWFMELAELFSQESLFLQDFW